MAQAGPSSGALASGDFNGDGALDLADAGQSVAIFLNGGKGLFTQEPEVPFGDSLATPTASGDFNGDGTLDLVTVSGDSISVLLGDGHGSFSPKGGQPISAQNNISFITTDMNGDGKLDLVVVDSTNAVSIWLGNGDGTFQAPIDTAEKGDRVASGDFNGDGRTDLAVTNPNLGTVTILLQGPPYKALVESPISGDGTSVFSAKRGVIPVKFTLTDDNIPTCTLPVGTISITRTAGGTAGFVDESVYVTSADTGSKFRIDMSACEYVYNVAASSLGIGTYRADISIAGVVVGHALFALR